MKPAIFNTAMVRAILDGLKTQTRRELKVPSDTVFSYKTEWKNTYTFSQQEGTATKIFTVKAPYKVGDIIYVRETWAEVFEIEYIDFGVCEREIKNISDCISNFGSISKTQVGMSSRFAPPNAEERMRYIVYKAENLEYANKKYKLLWNPSIHMPKEYARLFLRVKDVRIERLNEISEEDALAEGILRIDEDDGLWYPDYIKWGRLYKYAKSSFQTLWESIYGNGSFDNRYVWVIEFEQISKEEAMSDTAT